MIKQALGAIALIGTMATANASVLVSQDFNNVAALTSAGWVLNNASPNVGVAADWFQGVPSLMHAQAGATHQYIAAGYNNASQGAINNWLISPTFSVVSSGSISFWAKADAADGFSDQLAFGMSNGSSALNAFTLNPVFTVPTGEWTRYVLNFAGMGSGVARFGIQYSGSYEASNFVGVDSLLITTVPEPATMFMFGAGLLGLMAARRRQIRR
ncbi:choice-of-anchor J domain-containing protein [Massilia sp. TSP1-1-2]|uniref:choice-of-anchor J domain-containing protein n=1 Tax=unclassified Massilia TaxID=2609279 RepID=UPI003CF8EED2